MFTIIGTHVSMDVPDLEEAKEYLEETCEIKKLREVKKPDCTVTWYPGLELWQAGAESVAGSVKHVAWQVDDIREAMRSLKEKGVRFDADEPATVDARYLDTKEVVQYAFFSTPVGFRGELYQVDPPATRLAKEKELKNTYNPLSSLDRNRQA